MKVLKRADIPATVVYSIYSVHMRERLADSSEGDVIGFYISFYRAKTLARSHYFDLSVDSIFFHGLFS